MGRLATITRRTFLLERIVEGLPVFVVAEGRTTGQRHRAEEECAPRDRCKPAHGQTPLNSFEARWIAARMRG